jgi:hypothetical protein
MRCSLLPLLIALVLLGSHAVMAETPRQRDAMLPAQPPVVGFGALFRSDPGLGAWRPVQSWVASVPRVAGPPTASSDARGVSAAGGMCRPALIAAEVRYGIPQGLLLAIGLVESGRRDEQTGRREPWPWTLNAEGEPHFFETKQQSVAWVRQAQERGVRSIDVGCAQVNLMHHANAFASLEAAFDPSDNADYAARFLKQLHDGTAAGDWMTAAGQYHSQTPELADEYRRQVQAALGHALSPAPLPTPPGQQLRSLASLRPDTGRVVPAPLGTVGRGLEFYRAAPIQMALVTRPVPGRTGVR